MPQSTDETLEKIEALASVIASASGEAKPALQRQYLELIGHFLVDQQRGEALAFPLLDVIEKLDTAGDTAPDKQVERRLGLEPGSDDLMAYAAAVIDVLISAGYSLDHACQIVTRQMITRNVQIPSGGDARGWRNLQAWRHKLINSQAKGPAWRTYVSFKDEMPGLYGSRLAEAAAREAIWDRRGRV